MPGTIIVKPNREKPIRNQHPWIFSGAIEAVRDNPAPGDIVTVLSHSGAFLARGYWNPKSQIQVRILTWQDEVIDDEWWRNMIRRAVALRRELFPNPDWSPPTNSYRLINAENDYLPGLIVDRYGEWLVLQALTLHVDQQKQRLAHLLIQTCAEFKIQIKGIYERSDVDVRGKEGLKQETGLLLGEEPPPIIYTLDFFQIQIGVDVRNGHKTGAYLDQASNHTLFWDMFLMEKAFSILNLFSYTGGFGLFAAYFGATHVVNVDASREALELAEQLAQERERAEVDFEYIQADVFEYLRDAVAEGQQFDVVVCDPPKFAHNAQQVEKAARGYKDLNLNAFKLVKPGGYLITFSCSGAISRDLFQKIVFGALADSGRQAQIIRFLSAGDDHPVALTFPEGEYLKGLLLRVY